MGTAPFTLATVVASSALDVAPAVGFVTLAIAAAGLVAMGWLWRSTAPSRIEPGPPTMDLRDESPALVDLLTGDFRVDDDAVPATLVDLAARDVVQIDEQGGRVRIRIRRHGAPAADELTAYERRVLAHVARAAIDGVAPAEVLTIGPEGVSQRWFASFVREVNRHGQALGLCRRRFDLKHLVVAWAIVVVAAAPAWLVANAAPRTSDPRGWGSLGNLFVGLGILTGFALAWIAQRISRSNDQVDTAAGRDAAAHWLGVSEHHRASGAFRDEPAAGVAIWDRHLAYATAMGLAPVVQRQLPFETEHDRRAWSRATGTWRRVRVRYQAFVPGWGTHPGRVAFEGLIQAAIAGLIAAGGWYVAQGDLALDALTDDQRRWLGLGGLVVAALAALVTIFSLSKVVLGVADLFASRTVEGELVRCRVIRTGHRLPKIVQWAIWSGRDEHGMRRAHGRRVRHQLAIDTGDDDSIVAHVVRAQLYGSVRQGARVRAVVSPRLGYVRSIEMMAPPRASAATDPVVHHELVEDAAGRASAAVTGPVRRAMDTLEDATDEDGNALLDQVDEDGVTLRERLAASNEQLGRLRDDPRLRSSPIAGLLDSLLPPPHRDDESDATPGDDPSRAG